MTPPKIEEVSELLARFVEEAATSGETLSDGMEYTDLVIRNTLAYDTAGPVDISELSVYASVLQSAFADLLQSVDPAGRKRFADRVQNRLAAAKGERQARVQVRGEKAIDDLRAVFLERGFGSLIKVIGATDPASLN